MKILNVSNTIDPITGGGEAERSFQMSKFLAKSGASCRVLTVDSDLDEERKNFLGDDRIIALPCIFLRFHIPRVSMSIINTLVKEADIIHLMGHWNILNALVYVVARKQKKPYVVCPAGALPVFGRSKIFKKCYNFVIGKKIIRNASVCIAVTDDEKSSFKDYGVSLNKIHIIPNGISESDFKPEDDEKFRREQKIGARSFILFMGRLNEIKGPDLLLKAFCKLKDEFKEVDLVFVGPDSGMLVELQTISKRCGVMDRVHFLGYLGGNDKSYAYHAAKFLVIPSRHEAMSIVVLEAGVSGIPVLMTDQCGFNQIVEIGGGWVVPPTIDGITRGLYEVLSNMDSIECVALKLREYVQEKYSWAVIVQEYKRLYSKVLTSI